MSDQSAIISDIVGWKPSEDGLQVEVIFTTPDGDVGLISVDPGALLHFVPIAANTEPWREEAEAEAARTVRSYMDVDHFVLGLDTADRSKLTLSLRLESGGSLTFHFDRGFAERLRNALAQVLA